MMPKVPRRPGAQAASQATRARRKKRRQFGSQADLCRSSVCAACLALLGPGETQGDAVRCLIAAGYRPVHPEPHHEPSRGAGGTDRDCVPLCPKHHRERHNTGPSFWTKHGLDLDSIKARLRARLETT